MNAKFVWCACFGHNYIGDSHVNVEMHAIWGVGLQAVYCGNCCLHVGTDEEKGNSGLRYCGRVGLCCRYECEDA